MTTRHPAAEAAPDARGALPRFGPATWRRVLAVGAMAVTCALWFAVSVDLFAPRAAIDRGEPPFALLLDVMRLAYPTALAASVAATLGSAQLVGRGTPRRGGAGLGRGAADAIAATSAVLAASGVLALLAGPSFAPIAVPLAAVFGVVAFVSVLASRSLERRPRVTLALHAVAAAVFIAAVARALAAAA